jgi:hypothetical protein
MKYRNVTTVLVLFLLLLFALLFNGCSSAVTLVSDWKKSEMTIDGKQQEWEGSLYDLKKVNVTIGIRNDTANLYLCFISYDQGVRRQIMSGGFTVWFDPSGGTDERYGIQYHVGHPKGAQPMRTGNHEGPSQVFTPMNGDNDNFQGEDENINNMPPPAMPGNLDTVFSKPGFGKNNGRMPTPPDNALREVQFLGPEEKDVQQSTTLELKTMKVQVGVTQRAFIYELQVPLHRTDDFPFTLAPGKRNILGIRFKTENFFSRKLGGSGDFDGRQGGHPPGGGSEGAGGRQGGHPSGGGPGGRGGSNSNSSEPIDIRTEVILAQSSAGANK